MTLQERIDWWDRQLADLMKRGRKGKQNLELAVAMCIGAKLALSDHLKEIS